MSLKLSVVPSPLLQPEKVFVYGTLKRDLWNHFHMEDAGGHFVGDAVTELKWPLLDGGIPRLIFKEGLGHEVFGELFLVPVIGLTKVLDRLEGHPWAYRRTKIHIIASGKRHHAWTYFAMPYILPRKWKKKQFISNFSPE